MARLAAALLIALVFPAAAAGRVVVVAIGDDVTLFDHDSSRRLADVKVEGGYTRAAVVSPDGKRAFVAAGTTIAAIDLSARAVSRSVVLGTKARALAVSPDGRRLYVARRDAVDVLDAESLITAASIGLGASNPTAIAVSSDGTRGVVVLDQGRVAVLDLQRGTLVRRIRLAGASGVGFGPRGLIARVAAAGPGRARLVAVDARRGRFLHTIDLGTKTSGAVAITCDGGRAIIGSGPGSPRSSVVDIGARRVVRRLFADGFGPVPGVTMTRTRIFLGGRGVGVSVFSAQTYRRLPSLILGEGQRGYGIAAQPARRGCPPSSP